MPKAADAPPASPAATDLVPPFSNTLGMNFVPVPGTTVLFAAYETRVSDFNAFIKAGHTWTFRPYFDQTDSHPAVGANLQDALAFCNWLTETEQKQGAIKPNQSYRLPTNEEWSAAAGLSVSRQEASGTQDRMAENMKFPWGMEWPPPPGVGNFQEREIPGYHDGFQFTAPVGKFKPSPDGLFDLAGNVWEWTWDRQVSANPTGTLRGGCWAYFKRETLTAGYIYTVPADLRALTVGFRCVFEDKQRTAAMLAAMNAERIKAGELKRKELTQKADVDVEAIKRRLAGTGDPASTATLEPAVAGKRFRNSLRMDFVPVAGLPSLLVGATEVTVDHVRMWCVASGHASISQPHFNQQPNSPVVNISWQDARAFCEWLTAQDAGRKLLPAQAKYRLPTDEEWSVVAGLGAEAGSDPAQKHLKDSNRFPWGTDWPPRMLGTNLDAERIPGFKDSFAYTAAAGTTTPNSDGVYDLGGNVSEWCEDAWPDNADQRVARGGSWIMSTREAVLASARQHPEAGSVRFDLGFRCVLELGK